MKVRPDRSSTVPYIQSLSHANRGDLRTLLTARMTVYLGRNPVTLPVVESDGGG